MGEVRGKAKVLGGGEEVTGVGGGSEG